MKDIQLRDLLTAICPVAGILGVDWSSGENLIIEQRTDSGRRPSNTFQAKVVSFIVNTIWGPVISMVS